MKNIYLAIAILMLSFAPSVTQASTIYDELLEIVLQQQELLVSLQNSIDALTMSVSSLQSENEELRQQLANSQKPPVVKKTTTYTPPPKPPKQSGSGSSYAPVGIGPVQP